MDESETEREALITQVLELQSTLERMLSLYSYRWSVWLTHAFAELTRRVETVKDENTKLQSENQVRLRAMARTTGVPMAPLCTGADAVRGEPDGGERGVQEHGRQVSRAYMSRECERAFTARAHGKVG